MRAIQTFKLEAELEDWNLLTLANTFHSFQKIQHASVPCGRQLCLYADILIVLPTKRPTVYERQYAAISRKVVGKSARDNPERYCGWFWVHCFSKKFERMAREAMDICLWVLKESNKSWFDNYSVMNSVLNISHITSRDCRVHIFPTTFLEIAVYGLNQTDFKKVYRSCVSVLFWKKPRIFWILARNIHYSYPY